MNPDVTRTLLTIAFGALAGGVTNTLAVWMLFHPYKPPRLFGRPINLLQGAVPKNQGRLAVAMGRTVGTKLLTAEDLARTLAEPPIRAAFNDRLEAFVRSVFDERRGSVTSMLPAHSVTELRSLMLRAGDHMLLRLDTYLASESFRVAAERWVELLRGELNDRPIGDVLTQDRQAALTAAADAWLADAVESETFTATIRDYVDRAAVRLLEPDRTFQELLPQGLVAGVERAIAGYLPIAIERLGGLLDDPRARTKVEQILHELFDRFMRDLRFHQRLVAALLITPDMVDRVLKAVEKEGAAKISELLHDPAMRDAMAQGVNNAIVEFLARPVVSVIGAPGEESVENTKDTLVRWVLSLARDPQTRAFALEKLDGLLGSAQERTWGDLLKHVPAERVADAIVAAARSDRARELYREAAASGVDWVLAHPVGRLADKFGEDAAPRAQDAIDGPLWDWVQEQIPSIVQRLDVAGRVEQKILEFPTPALEALVRGVTERELQLIVRLGYVLGGVIGAMSAGLALLF